MLILISNSFRYPILRHLAPQFSGYNWIMDTICSTRNTLTEIISLHQRNNIREKNSYVDVYLKHIEEEEEPSNSKWDLVGYSGGSPGLENAVKRWGWPIGPICYSAFFNASP